MCVTQIKKGSLPSHDFLIWIMTENITELDPSSLSSIAERLRSMLSKREDADTVEEWLESLDPKSIIGELSFYSREVSISMYFFSFFSWIFLDIFPFESLHIGAFLLNLSFSVPISYFAVITSLHCFSDFFLFVFLWISNLSILQIWFHFSLHQLFVSYYASFCSNFPPFSFFTFSLFLLSVSLFIYIHLII